MVQVLPKFDPGGDIGKGVGGGFGEVLKMMSERDFAQNSLDRLKGLDTSNMTTTDIFTEVAKATVGVPGLQKLAPSIAELLIKQRQGDAFIQSRARGARGLDALVNQGGAQQGELRPDQMGEAVETTLGGDPLNRGGVDRGEVYDQAQRAPDQTMRRGQGYNIQETPRLREGEGRKDLLSEEETQRISEPLLLAGASADEINRALETARTDKLKQRELDIQRFEQESKEFDRARAFESEQAQNAISKAQETMQRFGMEPIQRLENLAYNYYDDFRKENPNQSDAKNWQLAQRRLVNKIEDIGKAQGTLLRPTFRQNSDKRTETTKRWAQGHLERFGSEPEDRRQVETMLMDLGWSREEAKEIVSPLDPKTTQVLKAARAEKEANVEMAGGQEIANLEQFKNATIPKLVKTWGPNQSPLVLKNQLVREKGLSDRQAVEFMEDFQDALNEQGKAYTDFQAEDINFIAENTVPSLYDLFSQGRKIIELFTPLTK